MSVNPDQLLELFKLTRNADNNADRTRAESSIQSFSKLSGFRAALLSIVGNHSVSSELRLLCIIFLKNNCDGFFRKGADKFILLTDDPDLQEKNLLKSQIIQLLLAEPDEKIFTQISLTIVNIAKHQPTKWAELFQILFETIQSNNITHRRRGLYTFQKVLKVLQQQRTLSSIKQFESLSNLLVSSLISLWISSTQKLIETFGQLAASNFSIKENESLNSVLSLSQIVKLCVKMLYLVMVYGIPDISIHPEAVKYFPGVIQALEGIFPSMNLIPASETSPLYPLYKNTSKIVLVLAKTIVDAQDRHSLKFSPYLVPYIKFFDFIIQNSFNANHEFVFEKLSVQALTFFTRVLISADFRGTGTGISFHSHNGISFDINASLKIRELLNPLLTFEFIEGLTRRLITDFLRLTLSELSQWNNDAEEFHELQATHKTSDSARLAAEALLTLLFIHFPNNSATILLNYLKEISNACPANVIANPASPDFNKVVLKEAIYNGLSLCAESDKIVSGLKELGLDFASLYTEMFAAELSNLAPQNTFLRRRIMLVIVAFRKHIPDALYSRIFENVASLLSEPDLVVRMTASNGLRLIVDTEDFPFRKDLIKQLGTYIEPIFVLSFKLISDLEALNTRESILRDISSHVELLNEEVKPALPVLLSHLPALWERCTEHNTLRIRILVAFDKLVKAMGADSVSLHNFLMPILVYCTDVNKYDERGYLVDTAIELWSSIIKSSPIYIPEMESLFPNILRIYNTSEGCFELALKLIESYALLGGNRFMAAHGDSLAAFFVQILPTLPTRSDVAYDTVAGVLETIGQLFPNQFPLLMPGVLKFMIDAILYLHKYESVPLAKRDPYDSIVLPNVVIGLFFQVLGRLFAQNFDGMVSCVNNLYGADSLNVLCVIIDDWADQIDRMSHEFKAKVCGIALANFFALNHPSILNRTPSILGAITSVADTLSKEEIREYIQSMLSQPDPNPSTAIESDRCVSLTKNDPTLNLDLKNYTLSKLHSLQNSLPQDQYSLLIASIDPLLMDALQNKSNSNN